MEKPTLMLAVMYVCLFYASLTAGTIVVNPNGSGDYMTIQKAVDNSNDGDVIEVSPGTYLESINFNGKAVRLYSSGGPELTVIDATGLNRSVVTCTGGEDHNTILEGLTLTGGTGASPGNGYTYGGGMYNKNSSPTVTNCIFSSNSATGDGGGMYNDSSSPSVTDCIFISNSAGWAGGGMDNRNVSHATVSSCVFLKNTAVTNGGGIENFNNSNPTVTKCIFSGNIAEGRGGGLYNESSSPQISNCLFGGQLPLAGGLKYEYYEGYWNYLPDFDSLAPVSTGMTQTLDISLAQRSDEFGFRFSGYLKIPVSGTYTEVLYRWRTLGERL